MRETSNDANLCVVQGESAGAQGYTYLFAWVCARRVCSQSFRRRHVYKPTCKLRPCIRLYYTPDLVSHAGLSKLTACPMSVSIMAGHLRNLTMLRLILRKSSRSQWMAPETAGWFLCSGGLSLCSCGPSRAALSDQKRLETHKSG